MPTKSINTPDKHRLPTRYNSPGVKERVFAARYPMTIGPKNPPRFPNELIRPIDAAAADSVRNIVGTDQKHG